MKKPKSRVFKDITLTWRGEEFTIPSTQVMGAIACVEETLTLVELFRMTARDGKPSMTKISMAYGSLLRHCGADVQDEEVYAGMFRDETSEQETRMTIRTLLNLMIPPDQNINEGVTNGAGEHQGQTDRAATSLSSELTKRPEAGV